MESRIFISFLYQKTNFVSMIHSTTVLKVIWGIEWVQFCFYPLEFVPYTTQWKHRICGRSQMYLCDVDCVTNFVIWQCSLLVIPEWTKSITRQLIILGFGMESERGSRENKGWDSRMTVTVGWLNSRIVALSQVNLGGLQCVVSSDYRGSNMGFCLTVFMITLDLLKDHKLKCL